MPWDMLGQMVLLSLSGQVPIAFKGRVNIDERSNNLYILYNLQTYA
jgi:hypothetical protein